MKSLFLIAALFLTETPPSTVCNGDNNGALSVDTHGTTWGCVASLKAWVVRSRTPLNTAGAQQAYDSNTFNGATSLVGDVSTASTKNKGTLLLDGGSPTVTVLSGAVCVCSNLAPLDGGTVHNTTCTVASTTMTAAGNKGDSIAYHCF